MPFSERHAAKMTKQEVKYLAKLIQYMKFRGPIMQVGFDFIAEVDLCQDLPALPGFMGCKSEERRAMTKSLLDDKQTNSIQKFDILRQEFQERNCHTHDEIFDKFTTEEMARFNAVLGIRWKEVAKQQLPFAIPGREVQLIPTKLRQNAT